MTYEQYWYGDVWMVGAFRKADRLKQERMNAEAWLAGLYVQQAIMSSIGNAFLAKGKQPMEYPEEPIPLFEDNSEEARREREEQEAIEAEAYMNSFVEFGKNWGKPQGGE